MLSWMVWTTPVATFFICIALMLFGMTVWEIRSPTVERKGWLPIPTTRGDRLFIGLLGAGFINLIWVGLGESVQGWFALTEVPGVWYSFVASMVFLAVLMRKG